MKTDAMIQQDVMAELQWEPSVQATHIGVEVANGVVTLTGHVGSYQEKYSAEQSAQRVEGVKALAVEMDVRLPSLSARTDGDIAHTAKSALQWMTSPLGDKVKVMVEKGWVTLSGDVDWQYQKLAAGVAVRYLLGVTGVSNQIAIKPAAKLSMTAHDIEAALIRRVKSDAKKIRVELHGSTVTLSGPVSNWAERDTARDAAWGTPGVVNVIDKMTMDW